MHGCKTGHAAFSNYPVPSPRADYVPLTPTVSQWEAFHYKQCLVANAQATATSINPVVVRKRKLQCVLVTLLSQATVLLSVGGCVR